MNKILALITAPLVAVTSFCVAGGIALTNDNKDLQNENKNLTETVTQITDENNKLKTERDALCSQIVENETLITSKDANIQVLTEEKQALQTSLSEKQTELDSVNSLLASKTAELEEKQAEIQSLEEKNVQLNNDCEYYAGLVEENKEKTTALLVEYNRICIELASIDSNDTDKIQELKNRKDNVFNDLQDCYRNEEELTYLIDKNISLIEANNKAIAPIVEERDSLLTEVNSLETEKEALTNEVNSLQAEVETKNARIAELESQVSDLNAQIETLQNEIAAIYDDSDFTVYDFNKTAKEQLSGVYKIQLDSSYIDEENNEVSAPIIYVKVSDDYSWSAKIVHFPGAAGLYVNNLDVNNEGILNSYLDTLIIPEYNVVMCPEPFFTCYYLPFENSKTIRRSRSDFFNISNGVSDIKCTYDTMNNINTALTYASNGTYKLTSTSDSNNVVYLKFVDNNLTMVSKLATNEVDDYAVTKSEKCTYRFEGSYMDSLNIVIPLNSSDNYSDIVLIGDCVPTACTIEVTYTAEGWTVERVGDTTYDLDAVYEELNNSLNPDVGWDAFS